MSDITNVVVPVAIAAGVNITARVLEKGALDSVNLVFANAALLVTLAGVGQFLDWPLATMLAIIYLMATMFTTGLPVIEWFTTLIGGK